MSSAPRWRRLALAGIASGAVHAGVVVFGPLEPRAPVDEPLPLAARLVTAPVPASATPLPPPPPQPQPRAPRPRTSSFATVAAPSAPGLPEAPETQETASEEPAVSTQTAAAPEAAEPVVVATAPASTFLPEPTPPPARSLARKGRITYNLVYGRDGFPVGRTVQTWQMDGGRYRLASRSETTGLVDIIRSQHRTYFSSGALTREGLRPEKFLMSRNRGRGTEEASAQFDWTGASVKLGSVATRREQSLPPGSQDLLSFMYQLSLDPPQPGRFRKTVTNGSRMEEYELEALPEENIDTPLGTLRTLPVKQIRKAGEESLQLWLAAEYRYLPVRIRFFNRAGEPQGEQVVTEIRISDE